MSENQQESHKQEEEAGLEAFSTQTSSWMSQLDQVDEQIEQENLKNKYY